MLLLLASLLACAGSDDKDTDTGAGDADTDTDTDSGDTDSGDTDTDTDSGDTDTDTDSGDTDSGDTSDTDTADTADTPEARGQALYTADCVRCHGENGDAGIGGAPDLNREIPRKSDSEITDVVKNGKGDMPGFPYDDMQMADMLAYLHAKFP